MKTLLELFSGVEVLQWNGNEEIFISSLAVDSRSVLPGGLFFACEGFRVDGNQFVTEAIDRGANVVVSAKSLGISSSVQVADVRSTLSRVARNYYQAPDAHMKVVGVTGTNGKTTTVSLLENLLPSCGSVGTIACRFGPHVLPATRTTPAPIELYSVLAKMRKYGCEHVAIEITSHGLSQKRVEGLQVDTAVFLNLTQDHLDYHGSMEEYFLAKKKLFTGEVLPRVAVINWEDCYGKQLAKELPSEVSLLSFGKGGLFRAENIQLGEGSRFDFLWPGGREKVFLPLMGHYNVSNALAALTACFGLGEMGQFVEKLSTFPGVPGRLEKVSGDGVDFQVWVDYAHTEDALFQVLRTVRKRVKGRLLVVFGCGGERDKWKRPLMTRVVQEWADFAWATSDNSRGEAVEAIFRDMKTGVFRSEKIAFVEERREAIRLAVETALPGDGVVVAGRGHESFQEVGGRKVAFDDRVVVRELLG